MIQAGKYHSSFTNSNGEKWVLEVDVPCCRGALRGDETGGDVIEIIDGELPPGSIFAPDEAAWLVQAWKEATGKEPVLPVWNRLVQAMRDADTDGRG